MFTQRCLQFPVLLCIITLLASCNGNNSTAPATTDSTSVSYADSASSANKRNASPQTTNLINKYLDTLWVDSAKFLSLKKKKLVFRFYLDSTESILMNGWTTDSVVYPLNPDLTLFKGRLDTTFKYKAGDYLGNLFLLHKDIDSIKHLIKKSKAKYVLFAPIDPATAFFKGQVTYNIVLTKDDPHPFAKPVRAVIPTGVKTNPSPPGTAN